MINVFGASAHLIIFLDRKSLATVGWRICSEGPATLTSWSEGPLYAELVSARGDSFADAAERIRASIAGGYHPEMLARFGEPS